MEPAQETSSDNISASSLLITPKWMALVTGMAPMGKLLMVMAGIVGIIRTFTVLYVQYYVWSTRLGTERDFYLMEDYNWMYLINTVIILALIYLYFRGIQQGYLAFKLLQNSQENDGDLLEGQEKAGSMFKWLALWLGLYVAVSVLELVLYQL